MTYYIRIRAEECLPLHNSKILKSIDLSCGQRVFVIRPGDPRSTAVVNCIEENRLITLVYTPKRNWQRSSIRTFFSADTPNTQQR